MSTERCTPVGPDRPRPSHGWSEPTRVVLFAALAACCATVLFARVYQQFERVRVKVVRTEQGPSRGSIDIPLPDLSSLAGFSPAVILRAVNREGVATTVNLAIDDAELAPAVVLPPERTVRIDLSMSASAGLVLAGTRSGSHTLRLRGEGDWSLLYLEFANVHGFSGGFFSFVIVPFGSDHHDSPSAVASLLVFGVIFLLSFALLQRRLAPVRRAQIVLGVLVVFFFLTTLVLPMVSKYKVLLSGGAFWVCVATLYSPALVWACTLGGAALRQVGRITIDVWIPALLGLFARGSRMVPRLDRRQATTLGRTLDVFSLVALAVAYPVFDILSRSPEFFAARNSTVGNVIALVLALCVVLPTLIVGIELVLAKQSAKAAGALHVSVLVVLVLLLVMPWLKESDQLGTVAPPAIALAVGVVFGIGHYRTQATRLFVTALAPAVLVVPALFLLDEGVWDAVLPVEQPFTAAEIDQTPPIVFIVFDEFPLNSLLNEHREIDSGRYPSFSALAADAYWFRNATTVSGNTVFAVPAIASGKYPIEPRAVPTRRYYPNNVFTMLSAQYDITVFGRFLQLCPPEECEHDLNVPVESLSALLADLGIVWLHMVLPEGLTVRLPTIVGDWQGFARNRWQSRDRSRANEFDRFLATIDGSNGPRLYFLHTMLPHMPFEYVPSGRRYRGADYQGTLEQGARLFENASAAFADAVHQRHLLQVGFVDQLLGRLRDQLKAQEIYDEALIIITADHGASYREGRPRRGFREEDPADLLLVPLFVKVPGQESGIVSDRLVETVDILPTVASVLAIDTPVGVDGQSLIEFDLPEREKRTFIRRSQSRLRPTEVEDLTDVSALSLKRKVDRFGTGTSEGLYSVSGSAHLLGLDVGVHADGRGSDVRVRVGGRNQFREIDLTQELWPLLVQGTVESGGMQPVRLAVAMNGRVAATTESYTENGEWVFATLLPEEYLRHGTNDLQVFLIDDHEGNVVLRSTSGRRRERD